jgi:hypothetical protein
MGDLHLRRALTLPFFSLFVLLMAREAVRAIDRLRGEPLEGWRRALLYGGLTLAPPVWQSVVGYGHIEQPIEIWLVLMAARWLDEQRSGIAGIALGGAILARSTALLYVVPLLFTGARRHGWSSTPRFIVITLAIALAGILVFFLADPADVVHSLVTYRSELVVGAGSIWATTHGSPLEPVAQHLDSLFIAASVIALNVWLYARQEVARPEQIYAGLALTAAAYALLAKTVWPYYFLELYVPVLVWCIGRRARAGWFARVIPPAAVVGLGLLAEAGAGSAHESVVRAEGAAMFVLLGAGMAWMCAQVTREPPPADPVVSTAEAAKIVV